MSAAVATLSTAQLTRILSSPRTAEVTGIYISYANDYAYLALAMQHPVQDTPIAVSYFHVAVILWAVYLFSC